MIIINIKINNNHNTTPRQPQAFARGLENALSKRVLSLIRFPSCRYSFYFLLYDKVILWKLTRPPDEFEKSSTIFGFTVKDIWQFLLGIH